VLGLPLLFLTCQLLLARQTLWLPPRIAARSISAELPAAILAAITGFYTVFGI
jgi:hypothetical protein